MSEQMAEEVFREAGTAIPVRQPPVDEVVALAQVRRRRRVTWSAGVVAGVLAAVGLGTWFGTRTADTGLSDAVVTQQENPANVEWYANGVLHLDHVAVELPQLEDLVTVPDGVVYGDADERVVLVDGEGSLTLLGRKVADTSVGGSAERGWVAWVDPGEATPELVAYDTLARKELGRRSLGEGGQLIAVDQDRVYFATPDGDYSWQLPDGEPERVLGGGLVDVASAVRVSQFPGELIRITQPLFDVELMVPGNHALVSPDGDYVLTHVDDPVPGAIRIYDAATGSTVETGLSVEEVALAAAFGPDDTVTYVVERRDNAPEGDEYLRLSETGSHLLRTCDLELVTCETVTQFAPDLGSPVLPR